MCNPSAERDFKFPRMGGVEPESELLNKDITIKLLKLTRVREIEPVSWFSLNFSWRKDFKFPTIKGMEPKNGFE